MRILITGGSGLLARALTRHLSDKGHIVFTLSRKPSSDGTIHWNPDARQLDLSSLEGFDIVIHLAGENLTGIWTANKRERIYASRIQTTRFLSESLWQLNKPPRVFISASAVGYYGDRGTEDLTEESKMGSGFLAQLCRDWEQAAQMARREDLGVVHMRLGVVLSADGGFLKKILPVFRLGLGGRIGDGRQYMSWIHIQDVCRAVEFIIIQEKISGPINITAPEPISNRTLTKTLGKILHRPTIFFAPAWLLKMVLGQMADEMLLASARVLPQRLQQSGFKFEYASIAKALEDLLQK